MVTARPKERWYLYGNDVALAEDCLRRDLAQAQTKSERAWLLKHWPSLGGFDAAEQWLIKEPALLEELPGKATSLRLLQHQGDPNPWRAMVPPARRLELEAFSESLAQSDQPLDLWLGAGLGDQLECLAVLCDPRLQAWWMRLRVLLPKQSASALKPLLQQYWPDWAPNCEFAAGTPRSLGQKQWLSSMSWSFCLAHKGLLGQPCVLVPGSPDRSLSTTLVCCWRSKVDPDERHWAHLRSWPFPDIARLYGRLVPWARRCGIRLVDITTYRPEERQTLLHHEPTLELVQPSINSLCDTAELLCQSRGVITVDTALVHLAAWFGWPTLLLLHLHPDERWSGRKLGLHQNHPIQVLRQTRYNSWREVSDKLLSSLADWPWL